MAYCTAEIGDTKADRHVCYEPAGHDGEHICCCSFTWGYDCAACQDTQRVSSPNSPTGFAACPECCQSNEPQQFP